MERRSFFSVRRTTQFGWNSSSTFRSDPVGSRSCLCAWCVWIGGRRAGPEAPPLDAALQPSTPACCKQQATIITASGRTLRFTIQNEIVSRRDLAQDELAVRRRFAHCCAKSRQVVSGAFQLGASFGCRGRESEIFLGGAAGAAADCGRVNVTRFRTPARLKIAATGSRRLLIITFRKHAQLGSRLQFRRMPQGSRSGPVSQALKQAGSAQYFVERRSPGPGAEDFRARATATSPSGTSVGARRGCRLQLAGGSDVDDKSAGTRVRCRRVSDTTRSRIQRPRSLPSSASVDSDRFTLKTRARPRVTHS